MNELRRWIKLVETTTIDEAAAFGVDSFWFNSANGQIIQVGDHGDAVIASPNTFGIDQPTQDQMHAAFPEGMDSDPPHRQKPVVRAKPAELRGAHATWDRNDAWETLAMNRGWVRVGGASKRTSAYVSSCSGAAVWPAINHLYKNQGIDEVDIEIVARGMDRYVTISGDDLKMFLRGGPKRADAYLAAHA